MIRAEHFAPSSENMALLMEAGFVYRYLGRFSEARDVFRGVRALIPMNYMPDLALAGISLDEGKFEEAETCCRRAIQLNPGSGAAYAHLAEVQLFRNDKTTATLNLRRALELNPNGPTADLAHALLRLAEFVTKA
ncbi:MAG TPA: tetratricopeptide repeat protein [Bryobacteraceae bacterium]|jgi:Flp pilus assembly protein TadD|nr:tetratricopeptide repeat protein [Bryobacteraceae bacterium]